jgi:phage gp45-like
LTSEAEVFATLERILLPLKQRISLMVSRGMLLEHRQGLDGAPQIAAQIFDGETAEDLEPVGHHGFYSLSPEGSDTVVLFPGGDRSMGLVVSAEDRRYRPRDLQPGETVIYNTSDQLGPEEELPEEPEGLPEGVSWPTAPEPSGPGEIPPSGPPLCRIHLKDGRVIEISGNQLNATALESISLFGSSEVEVSSTGSIKLSGTGSVELSSTGAITLAAPEVKVTPMEGLELDLVELVGTTPTTQPVAHIGDPVEVEINGTTYCGEIVEECTGV